ncbi:MAG: tyrosine-type recombinase/integrase [Bacteroidales bacterium]|nr:tyrosine-type recombinase/integrase [Bacteroidales bacterium]
MHTCGKTGNSWGISFSLKRYGKGSGSYMIRMRIRCGGLRTDVATGFRLPDPALWDAAAQRMKAAGPGVGNRSPDPGEVNRALDRLRQRAEGVCRCLAQQRRGFSAAEFREMLAHPPRDATGLFPCLEEFVRQATVRKAWTAATAGKFRNLGEDLRRFRADLGFGDLKEETLEKLVGFWREERGLGNRTVEGKLSCLRWFLNWATENGYNENPAYRRFRPTFKRPRQKVIFLTEREMRQLQALSLPRRYHYLEKVRDLFLFCCFSGLRFSDAVNLRRSDIRENCLEVTTVKTADSLRIELNAGTRAILYKYRRDTFPGDRALPPVLNQTMNRDLKTLCRMAGIDEPVRITRYRGSQREDTVRPKYALVGTHTGRRTFIVHALSLGIPPNVVMKWTGHADYKAMKPYIDIVDEIKAQEMAKMDRLFRTISGPGPEDGR